MTPGFRRWIFLAGVGGVAAFYLWGLVGLPGFGNYPGPYGDIINAIGTAQTNATAVVSAVNFDYRGFDTVGEEFILFMAATGVATVLRHLREDEESPSVSDAAGRDAAETSDALRMTALVFVGPALVVGWYLTTHAQFSPSGGFQGGVVMATAFFLVYLAGQYLAFHHVSPTDLTEAVEAIGAGGFVAVGVSAVAIGLAYLTNVLPLGLSPGEVDSSGTIALISFLVGVEVTASFILIAGELLQQTLIVRRSS